MLRLLQEAQCDPAGEPLGFGDSLPSTKPCSLAKRVGAAGVAAAQRLAGELARSCQN